MYLTYLRSQKYIDFLTVFKKPVNFQRYKFFKCLKSQQVIFKDPNILACCSIIHFKKNTEEFNRFYGSLRTQTLLKQHFTFRQNKAQNYTMHTTIVLLLPVTTIKRKSFMTMAEKHIVQLYQFYSHIHLHSVHFG